MKRLLIANRKGGVAKTTTTVTLGYLFAKTGLKVLIVDLDTQGHIQYGLGIKHCFEHGIHTALEEESVDVKLLIQKSRIKNLDFIPANINFNSSKLQGVTRLDQLLEPLEDRYDLILIDTAPMSDTLLEMALFASNYVVVPMKTEYLGLVGTVQFIKIFYKTASKIETDFTFLGVIPTLYNKSLQDHQETIEKLTAVIGSQKVLTPIRKDTKMSNIFKYGIRSLKREHSRAFEDYKEVAKSLLEKLKTHSNH